MYIIAPLHPNCHQSHYIEVAQGDIFMEQYMRFGPTGNTEKKNWADYEQLLRAVFSCFHETPPCVSNFYTMILIATYSAKSWSLVCMQLVCSKFHFYVLGPAEMGGNCGTKCPLYPSNCSCGIIRLFLFLLLIILPYWKFSVEFLLFVKT
jgi:hypothetical protein